LIPDGENRDTLTRRRWFSFQVLDRVSMGISELLKAEQMLFMSLAELLVTLSQFDDGCEISAAARFLRLKLITAPNGTRPNWEKIRWSLTGPEIVQSRSKDWNEAISLLEGLCSEDCEALFSDEKFLKAYFYGFDRAGITAFIASCGIQIEGDKAVVLEQSRVDYVIDPGDQPSELQAVNMALRALTKDYGDLHAKMVASEQSRVEVDIDPADQPYELQAANLAFRAVTNGHGDPLATFRNRLIGYLETTYPELKNHAVQRIATVANPDKTTGCKKSRAE